MADSSQLKRIDPVDFGDDDPFAELTKIMGFDPRIPVRPDAPAAERLPAHIEPAASIEAAPTAQDPELDFSADDFSIDLEKELLGDFALEDEPAEMLAAAPAAVAVEPVFELAGDTGVDMDFDVAFAADLDDELAFDRLDPVVAGVAGTESDALVADIDFDEAFAVSPAHVSPASADARLPAGEALSAEDAELIAALEPAVLVDRYEVAHVPASGAAEDMDLDFDIAMADVDMDFNAGSELGAYRVELPSEPRVAETEQPHPAGTIDFDDFDEALFEGAAASVEAASAPLGYAPVARAEVAEAAADAWEQSVSAETYPEELSLEDELNALLGNSVPRAELAGGYDGPPLSAAVNQASVPAADDFADLETDPAAWDPHTQAVAGADEQSYFPPRQGYAPAQLAYAPAQQTYAPAQLAYAPAQQAYAPAQEAYAPATQGYDHDAGIYAADEAEADDDYAGPSYQVAEVQYVQEDREPEFVEAVNRPAEAGELEFDDGAFHAAFENSLASDDADDLVSEDDPYAALRPTAEYATRTPSYVSAAPLAAGSGWQPAVAPVEEDIPDIDTVDVPESAFAVADDLDIPELAYEDEVRAAPAYDEFEPEFSAVYADQAPAEETNLRPSDAGGYAQVERGYGQFYGEPQSADDGAGHFHTAGVAAAAAGVAYASASRPDVRRDFDAADDFDLDDLPGGRRPAPRDAFDALDYDDDLDDEIVPSAYAAPRPEPQRRGLLVAAIVGGVAVLGGVGALALSFGGDSGSDVPAIVRADETPIKVRPENPGGVTVPNQDNKVYETVAGGKGPAMPEQEKLISSAEEPVDMAAKAPAPSPEAAPTPDARVVGLPTGDDEIVDVATKAEDRIEPSVDAAQPGTDSTEVAAVAPRRVRTMVVRPDGTLVPREDPAPAALAEPHGAAEAMMESTPATPAGKVEVTNTTGPSFQAPGAAPVPVEAAAPAKPAKARAETAGTPASVPLAPARPADQPVDVVGEVKPEKVAAVSSGAAAAGAWSMQIASQPSEDAAKSTYQDLARRYGSVIGGHGVSIVKAEIAGKGTFWRVRVPAGSRNEAISLCESYKAAGGNCFVSK